MELGLDSQKSYDLCEINPLWNGKSPFYRRLGNKEIKIGEFNQKLFNHKIEGLEIVGA
jgi:hypothetical protein